MGAPLYAFRDSSATQAKADILSTMNNIRSTLQDIGHSIDRLRPEWTATEANRYFDVITKWKNGAEGINNILKDVEKALDGMQQGNTGLRNSISKVLDETN